MDGKLKIFLYLEFQQSRNDSDISINESWNLGTTETVAIWLESWQKKITVKTTNALLYNFEKTRMIRYTKLKNSSWLSQVNHLIEHHQRQVSD